MDYQDSETNSNKKADDEKSQNPKSDPDSPKNSSSERIVQVGPATQFSAQPGHDLRPNIQKLPSSQQFQSRLKPLMAQGYPQMPYPGQWPMRPRRMPPHPIGQLQVRPTRLPAAYWNNYGHGHGQGHAHRGVGPSHYFPSQHRPTCPAYPQARNGFVAQPTRMTRMPANIWNNYAHGHDHGHGQGYRHVHNYPGAGSRHFYPIQHRPNCPAFPQTGNNFVIQPNRMPPHPQGRYHHRPLPPHGQFRQYGGHWYGK